MKQGDINVIERQVVDFRQENGLNDSEAINLKSLLLKLNVLTIFRPLSVDFSGMSLKSPTGERFMLVNSLHPRGRRHYTIAHELYHLFIEENPKPHYCSPSTPKDESEQRADLFASMLLMPATGIKQLIPTEELRHNSITLSTVIRLEHYFSVSRQAIIYRLASLKLISKALCDNLRSFPATKTAKEYGYDIALYNPGNDGLVIGDFGDKARHLFDEGKISEGHYRELMSKIGINVDEN